MMLDDVRLQHARLLGGLLGDDAGLLDDDTR